jgi:hypothetical protein
VTAHHRIFQMHTAGIDVRRIAQAELQMGEATLMDREFRNIAEPADVVRRPPHKSIGTSIAARIAAI